MQGSIEQFLTTSKIAGTTRIPARIVVHRDRLSPHEIARIAEIGEYAIDTGKGICELEVGGQVIGLGKIVRKGGQMYFKLLKAAPLDGRRE
jgi:hypothetical protein